MSWDLSDLDGVDPTSLEWDIAKSKIVKRHLDSIKDPKRRRTAFLMQLQIDAATINMSPEEANIWIWKSITENLLNLQDQLVYLKSSIKEIIDDS